MKKFTSKDIRRQREGGREGIYAFFLVTECSKWFNAGLLVVSRSSKIFVLTLTYLLNSRMYVRFMRGFLPWREGQKNLYTVSSIIRIAQFIFKAVTPFNKKFHGSEREKDSWIIRSTWKVYGSNSGFNFSGFRLSVDYRRIRYHE